MNHSLYNADRTTHLKIVVTSLACATLVAAVGIFAHVNTADFGAAHATQAGQPMVMSGQLPTIR